MSEQSTIPLLEFLRFIIALSLPVFLVGLAIFVCVLRRHQISWLRIIAITPLWLSSNALLTIILWVVMGDLNWQFEYDFLMTFTPALIATIITIPLAYLLSKRFLGTSLKMDKTQPHSTDET